MKYRHIFILAIITLLGASCVNQQYSQMKQDSLANPDAQLSDKEQELEENLGIRPPTQPRATPFIPDFNKPLEEQVTAQLETNLGNIKVKLFTKDAPKTVNNFIQLAQQGFYDGVKFHRVIKDFMIQTGDPNSKDQDWSNDGMGGPGYEFNDEINSRKIVKGRLAMANSGPNTNGSQFFIVTASATPWLDGKHTVFGEVTEGFEIIDKIELVETNQNNHPISDITIKKIKTP